MSRPRYEAVSKMLNRLSTTIKKKTSPKSPKKAKSRSQFVLRTEMLEHVECKVTLKHSDETTVDTQVLCNNEITSGMSFEFESLNYLIMRNPPVTTAIKLHPKSIVLSDYPIVPTITVENCDGADCLWFCELKDKEVVFLGSGVTCTPNASCVGNRIKMICTPWRWAEEYDLTEGSSEGVPSAESSSASSDGNLSDLNACGELNHSLNETAHTTKERTFSSSNQMMSADERSKFPSRRVITGRAAVCYSSGVVRATIAGSKILETRREFNEMQKCKGGADLTARSDTDLHNHRIK